MRRQLSTLITRTGLRPLLAQIDLIKSRGDPLKSANQGKTTEVTVQTLFREFEYKRNGRIPWSTGYYEYKMHLVDSVLADPQMVEIFRQGGLLPAGYANRIDERAIEFPWIFAHLADTPTLLLDAGSTLNHATLLSKPLLTKKTCVIYTLAPEAVYASPSVSYIYGDLRDTILRDNWFDEITCVSTLEHVGMDNTLLYTKDEQFSQKKPMDYIYVLKEFNRLLKPGGRLLFTVPYGLHQIMDWQQQFDWNMLQAAINAFGGEVAQKVFYQYTADGWQISDAEACASCEYFNIHERKIFDTDYAAAARSVACIELVKST